MSWRDELREGCDLYQRLYRDDGIAREADAAPESEPGSQGLPTG